MNYSTLIKSLTAEAFSAKQYKKMGLPYSIIAFVGVLPFFIFAFLSMVVYHVYTFLFHALSAAVNYLEGWVDEKKKDVNMATEAVIYFLTVPFIFFNHIILSIFSLLYFILWFELQCFTYIASLGGIKWQPYISYAKYDDAEMTATTNTVAAQVFAFSAAILFVIAFIMNIAGVEAGSIIFAIYYIAVAIAAPIIFKKKYVCASDCECLSDKGECKCDTDVGKADAPEAEGDAE